MATGMIMVAETGRVERCRLCGGPAPAPFLDLGETPIANSLLTAAEDGATQPQYPLEVGCCGRCGLVQLTFVLPADAIFSASYPYFSSFSDVLVGHARQHALELIERRRLHSQSLVLEVASNDGYLLRHFVEAGIPVLGIEPTPGPSAAARSGGVRTLEAFFTEKLAERLFQDGVKADVIIANNVMAHVPDLNGFVAGLSLILAEGGIITIENPYVRDLVQNVAFDTIYHEHYSYFSCVAVAHLMRRHGLFLNDVEYFPTLHGGTLRWSVGRREETSARALEFLAAEHASGLAEPAYYADFGQRVRQTQSALVALLRRLKADGAEVAAYGAAAKGATLLNASGIDRSLVSFVVDRNTHKQGHWMPGIGIPILHPSALLERRPDYLLLLAWNFKDEIMRQQDAFHQRGGRFIVPVPTPRIL